MKASPLKTALRSQHRQDLEAINRLDLIRQERKETYLVHFERWLDVVETLREIREGARNATEALAEVERLGL